MSEMKADLLRQEVVRTITVQFEETLRKKKTFQHARIELSFYFPTGKCTKIYDDCMLMKFSNK